MEDTYTLKTNIDNLTQEDMDRVRGEEWFEALVDECKSTVVESEFVSRMALVTGYHELGKLIKEKTEDFNRAEIYGKKIVQCIAECIGKSERSVRYAVQFYEKYPDLSLLPKGKNVSWYKITQKYLPQSEKSVAEEEAPQKPKVELKWNKDTKLFEIFMNPEEFQMIDFERIKDDLSDFLKTLG
jgi:hypothetical protein